MEDKNARKAAWSVLVSKLRVTGLASSRPASGISETWLDLKLPLRGITLGSKGYMGDFLTLHLLLVNHDRPFNGAFVNVFFDRILD